MSVGVCGSRSRGLSRMEVALLKDILRGLRCERLVHGGASGIDSDAGRVAGEMGIDVLVHSADWQAHGRKSGPIRNRRQARYAKIWIAFTDGCGPGTRDMIRAARHSGAVVIQIDTGGVIRGDGGVYAD